jgi:hypothetical protein
MTETPIALPPANEISASPTFAQVGTPQRRASRRAPRRTVDDDDRDAAMALMFLLSVQRGLQAP